MFHKLKTWAAVLLVAGAMMGVNGCAAPAGPAGGGSGVCAGGKCDVGTDERGLYAVDMAKANAVWPGSVAAETPEDLMRVHVTLGDRTIVADTHLFGEPVNVIPYHNADGVTDADGASVARGDAVIAAYFPPGEIAIAVKHHRPEHRELALSGGDPDTMKEHFKLQDTHIEIVVGVERDGQPGAITLNNPQTYEGGRFGNDHYPMIFLRPVYPAYLSAEQQVAFRDNIRTMAAGFNAVSNFPGDYNGGDPLAARNPEMVREHVSMMVRAIAGDEAALAWFQDEAHMIYCAELAFVSMSAGMIAPLNADTIVPLVGEDVWARFQEQVAKHNAGEPSAFTRLNDNTYAAMVRLDLAPAGLGPASDYAPAGSGAESMLAFQPMTMADIVEQFMATHMPRRELGEALAPLQGAALEAMKPGLLEAMKLDAVPLMSEQAIAEAAPEHRAGLMARYQVEQLFHALIGVVSTSFASYDDFRAALAPLMAQARAVTGPRDGSGNGLFVPPSIMHVVAQGRHPAGLLGLDYVGHGFHWSMVRGGAAGPTEPGPAEPTPSEPAPSEPTTPSAELLSEAGDIATGAEERFTVTLPEGATGLVVEMLAEGDPDLYVRRGSAPTENAYECRPYLPAGEAETCTVDGAAGDTFHILVRGYEAGRYVLSAKATR